MKHHNHTVSDPTRLLRVGILDHLSGSIGGSTLVVAEMAAQLSQHYAVDVIHNGQGYTLASVATAFGLDLTRVNERIMSNCFGSFSPRLRIGYLRRMLQLDRQLTEPYDLFIYSGYGVPPLCSARHGLVYCHFPFESHPNHEFLRINGWEKNRSRLNRWLRLRGKTWLWNWRMQGYQTLLGNSKFTSGWIERRWERLSEVLYPPVAIWPASIAKENIIVSLGRFTASGEKNHAVQLKAFRQFLSTTGGGWRLCLIGFCTDLPRDRAYLEKLQAISGDIPVTFVVNAPRQTLWTHLANAKLYWHAKAIGGEGNVLPQNTEHFGIATVEAMGAGCVPLVPMSGGQPEIVEHEVSGFLCRDAQALLQYTSRLAGDELLCQQMGRAAKERSALFCPETFQQRLSQVVAEALCESRSTLLDR